MELPEPLLHTVVQDELGRVGAGGLRLCLRNDRMGLGNLRF